jgi:hypothetical protein
MVTIFRTLVYTPSYSSTTEVHIETGQLQMIIRFQLYAFMYIQCIYNYFININPVTGFNFTSYYTIVQIRTYNI